MSSTMCDKCHTVKNYRQMSWAHSQASLQFHQALHTNVAGLEPGQPVMLSSFTDKCHRPAILSKHTRMCTVEK